MTMADLFNPKCNQSTGTVKFTRGAPSCAEAAAQGMKRHAEYRAQQAAYERAKAAERVQQVPQPDRWLKPGDLT
ncbi:hypothetical protein [Ruegeria sediminis]|uniref:hypothetical protein n=1 Tax=Ruegeria sediminis TaxID=2583820 RepID=UPI001C557440|nr:hypothetical protein [Ruegeria sediminis]